ncbi:hypothetical protein CDAR_5791 [Caerostris darwini]|uniref:Uncharacterized protein n=1 Tax=Caerostris darwini TaxID=1538125 RepID=A0AAV4RD68_9ARAC|nr:hypothetical protein CDAR_5791 [Caerostris darwini]
MVRFKEQCVSKEQRFPYRFVCIKGWMPERNDLWIHPLTHPDRFVYLPPRVRTLEIVERWVGTGTDRETQSWMKDGTYFSTLKADGRK